MYFVFTMLSKSSFKRTGLVAERVLGIEIALVHDHQNESKDSTTVFFFTIMLKNLTDDCFVHPPTRCLGTVTDMGSSSGSHSGLGSVKAYYPTTKIPRQEPSFS